MRPVVPNTAGEPGIARLDSSRRRPTRAHRDRMQRPQGRRDASRRVGTRPDCRASRHETLDPERPASRMAPCPARDAPTADHGRARGKRQMSSSLAEVLSSGRRTPRRQRPARLCCCAWRHGKQRHARHTCLMPIHSTAFDAQPPAQTGPRFCAVDPAESHMGRATDRRKPARDTRHRERAAGLRPGRHPQSTHRHAGCDALLA